MEIFLGLFNTVCVWWAKNTILFIFFFSASENGIVHTLHYTVRVLLDRFALRSVATCMQKITLNFDMCQIWRDGHMDIDRSRIWYLLVEECISFLGFLNFLSAYCKQLGKMNMRSFLDGVYKIQIIDFCKSFVKIKINFYASIYFQTITV